MKIHQLPLGARFEYEGAEYVKTGPMFGTGKGGQRLIPKFALLKPLGEQAPGPGPQGKLLAKDAVLEAFDAFHRSCSALVPEDRHGELDAARQRFLDALG